jgi:hypothetical protein
MTRSSRRAASTLSIVLLALVLAATASAGSSAAGSLTSGAVRKIAKKVVAKQLKKAAPALSVGNADRLGGVPASDYARNGIYQVSVPPIAWQAGSATQTLVRSTNTVTASIPNAGNAGFLLTLPVPSAVNGVRMRLTKLRYCYTASATGHLTTETLSVVNYQAGQGTIAGGPQVTSFDAQTPGCRVVSASVVLSAQDNVVLSVTFATTTSSVSVGLGAVTAQFEPTTLPADAIG